MSVARSSASIRSRSSSGRLGARPMASRPRWRSASSVTSSTPSGSVTPAPVPWASTASRTSGTSAAHSAKPASISSSETNMALDSLWVVT